MKSFNIDFTGKTGADFKTEGVAKSFKFGNYYVFYVVENETDPAHEGLTPIAVSLRESADTNELMGVTGTHITDDTNYEWTAMQPTGYVMPIQSQVSEVDDVDTGFTFPE